MRSSVIVLSVMAAVNIALICAVAFFAFTPTNTPQTSYTHFKRSFFEKAFAAEDDANSESIQSYSHESKSATIAASSTHAASSDINPIASFPQTPCSGHFRIQLSLSTLLKFTQDIYADEYGVRAFTSSPGSTLAGVDPSNTTYLARFDLKEHFTFEAITNKCSSTNSSSTARYFPLAGVIDPSVVTWRSAPSTIAVINGTVVKHTSTRYYASFSLSNHACLLSLYYSGNVLLGGNGTAHYTSTVSLPLSVIVFQWETPLKTIGGAFQVPSKCGTFSDVPARTSSFTSTCINPAAHSSSNHNVKPSAASSLSVFSFFTALLALFVLAF